MAPTTRSVSLRLNGRALQHVPSVHAPLNGGHRITKHNAAPKAFFASGNRGRPYADRWRPSDMLDRSRPRRSRSRESGRRDSVMGMPRVHTETGHADDVQMTYSGISRCSSSSPSTSPEDKPEDDDELEEGEIREYGKSSQSSETTPSPRRSPLWDAIHAWEALQSSQSSSTSSRRSAFRQRRDFGVVDRSRCLPGVVFETAYHTAMGSAGNASADNLTETTRGYVYTKYRKFVLLEKHATHIQALPIYTHNGTGLDHKRQFEHEFVCVRDRDCPADEREPEEGVHGTLFGVREPGSKATFIGGRAVLKLTEMVSFSIHAAGGLIARVEGRLEHDSLRKLACLVQDVRAERLDEVFAQGGGSGDDQKPKPRPSEEVLSKLARENHGLKANMILIEANHKTAVMQEQRENERLKRRIEQLEAEVAKLRGQTTEGGLSPKWAKLDF